MTSFKLTTESKCPLCGFQSNEEMPEKLKRLIKGRRFTEHINPGGRELNFENEGRIQLSDMCNHCDNEKLYNFLTGENEITANKRLS
jgi:hypothetical protein